MELVALLSTGKGTWGQVAGIVNRGEWDKVVIITSEFFRPILKNFDFAKKADIIYIDFNKDVKVHINELKEKLKNKIQDIEVALTIASGSGKEHMAIISALLQLPVGIKFVILTKEGLITL